MPVNIIFHKGKSIIFDDYTPYKKSEEMLANMKAAEKLFIANPTIHLLLVDFTNTRVNTDFMENAKGVARRVLNKQVDKAAVLGVTGVKKVLLSGYNLVTKVKYLPFDTKEEALAYLTE